MESDVVADALEDDALEVVVEEIPRYPAEGGEGLDVAPDEALQRLVEREAGEDGAAVRQHHHEAGQGPLGVADGDLAEVAPVDLGLLAGERLEAEVGLGSRRRSYGPHVVPDLARRPGVAALAHHLVKARGERLRQELELLQQRIFIAKAERIDSKQLELLAQALVRRAQDLDILLELVDERLAR
jgi:hypothetical protein